MGAVKAFFTNLFNQADQFLGQFLGGILDSIYNFLNGNYTILALVLVFLGIIILIGLFRWLFRSPKSFLFVLILFGAVGAIWFFFGRETASEFTNFL